MWETQRRVIRRGAAVLGVAVAAAALGGPTVAQAGTVNNDGRTVVFWSNNIENLAGPSCSGDWNKLFAYIKAQPKSPDIFAVQQISGPGQLNELTARMTRELPGNYGWRIALSNPGSVYPGSTNKCDKAKNKQTNAIIYRTDRFAVIKYTHWRSDAPANFTGKCKNLTATRYQGKPTSQDRVENVAVQLRDVRAGKTVSVASVHWPTGKWKGPNCADENMKEAKDVVNKLGGNLKIVAGDMNAEKGAKGWWNDARRYGFRDPMAETNPVVTNGKRRIDFLLVKGSHGFSGAKTVTATMAGGTYSDHRALTAYVKY